MAKNASFHIKLPVKNFHGRAKAWGSHRTVALPLNTPLRTTYNCCLCRRCALWFILGLRRGREKES